MADPKDKVPGRVMEMGFNKVLACDFQIPWLRVTFGLDQMVGIWHSNNLVKTRLYMSVNEMFSWNLFHFFPNVGDLEHGWNPKRNRNWIPTKRALGRPRALSPTWERKWFQGNVVKEEPDCNQLVFGKGKKTCPKTGYNRFLLVFTFPFICYI